MNLVIYLALLVLYFLSPLGRSNERDYNDFLASLNRDIIQKKANEKYYGTLWSEDRVDYR